MYRDFLPWTAQKCLNRSICRLRCGLGWTEGSIIRQLAPTCPHGRAHWRHLANTIEPSVCGGDAMRSYVKLLWPLVTVIIKQRLTRHVSVFKLWIAGANDKSMSYRTYIARRNFQLTVINKHSTMDFAGITVATREARPRLRVTYYTCPSPAYNSRRREAVRTTRR